MKGPAPNLPDHTPLDYTYDGSFQGFLCVVFQAFQSQRWPISINAKHLQSPTLFTEDHYIETTDNQAERVWQGLIRKTSARNAQLMHVSFLSELPGTEMLLWRYLHKIFTKSEPNYYQNMLDEDVYQVWQTARKVHKEAHLFLGFVRFQQATDDLLFAPIEPDHNILHLLAPHFKKRFAQQSWVIYDMRRRYGIYHDQQSLAEVHIDNPEFSLQTGQIKAQGKALDEDYYQGMWQTYYDAVNISARANPRQMKQMMPRRYWRYLPEKNRRPEDPNP